MLATQCCLVHIFVTQYSFKSNRNQIPYRAIQFVNQTNMLLYIFSWASHSLHVDLVFSVGLAILCMWIWFPLSYWLQQEFPHCTIELDASHDVLRTGPDFPKLVLSLEKDGHGTWPPLARCFLPPPSFAVTFFFFVKR